MDNRDIDGVKSALKKRALGYDSTEVTEEYTEGEDGSVRLIKRKVVSKNVPPDVSAVKLLIDIKSVDDDITLLTDEELEKEKLRLIKMLKEKEDDNCKN